MIQFMHFWNIGDYEAVRRIPAARYADMLSYMRDVHRHSSS